MKMYYCTRKSVFRHVPCIHGLCRKLGYEKRSAGQMLKSIETRYKSGF